MAKKWWAGWKLFREEDPTTPTATQYQSSGGSSGGVETPDFSPTTYEGDFQSPIVLPTPQSEQRQTGQEIQGTLMEGSEIWVPSSHTARTRMRLSKVKDPVFVGETGIQSEGGAVAVNWFTLDQTDISTPKAWAEFLHNSITQADDVANALSFGVGDSDLDVPNQLWDALTQIEMSSGIGGISAGTAGAMPFIRFWFEHEDNVAVTRQAQVRFEMTTQEEVALYGVQYIEDLKATGCKAQRTAAQTYTTNTTVALSCTAADIYDTDALHDPAANATRITTNKAGLWHIGGDAQWSANPVNGVIYVFKNGVQIGKGHQIVGDYRQMHIAIDDYATAAGDYYELFLFQNSGSDKTATGSFWAHWVGG